MKLGSKRGSGYSSGLGSAVLTAPEESYASEPGVEAGARGARKGPAPAGAYQRGFGGGGYQGLEAERGAEHDEPEYVPRRGNRLKGRFYGIPRSVGGRIVFGVLVFVLLGGVAMAVGGARYYLMHDARFVLATSDDVQIVGAEHLTRDQVLTVFGADLERNIFRVPLAERQTDVERLPWVAHATVMRLLPDVLRVKITERTPVAFVRQGTQIGLVDGSGVLLDMPPDAAGDPHYSFPVLTGLSAQQTMDERATRMDVYQQFMKDLDSTGQHLTDSVSEVDVSDPEDVKALITSGSSDILVHFGEAHFLQRYQEFEQHVGEWKQQYPKLASADMRYEGQIVLEMQGDGDAVAAGDRATASITPLPVAAAVVAPVVAKVARSAAAKAAAPKLVAKVSRPVATKPNVPRATAVVPKPVAVSLKPGVGAPKLSAKAGKPAPKVVAHKPAAKRAAAHKPVKWTPAKKKASGVDAANEKVFARLAAAHRAAIAKEHKTAGTRAEKSSRAGGANGVTP
ncbi:MAG: FtsQ-type POTRA domain-containing protein [Acidobacteriaceae bacterium]